MTSSKLNSITPVILAGGKSSRMGRNKSFVTLAGKPLIEIVIDTVTSIFPQPPVIVTNSPGLYEYLGLTMAGDIYQEKGPLAGIHTGLIHSSTAYSFVFGCDMPFLDTEFIKFMVSRLHDEQVLIPRNGKWVEPLHALYAQNCLPYIEVKLNHDICRIQSFFSEVYIGYVDVNEYGHNLKCFANINSQADLAAAETIYEKSNK
ncbi:molybdenum cofactor guanylyltransferase [Sporomusa sp.]|uniref:molybdenum cofactor guanylyltransferase n=1 Tax=Sporomusa sp. TaxID=2078658 RepID=UPI002C09AB3F|nr:molybdenum cofactor guanylyltransferase [Sporomusa sp.]HWR43328.1 molybdenum cofactor guanylyltransferase [Sporomusa sp.]